MEAYDDRYVVDIPRGQDSMDNGFPYNSRPRAHYGSGASASASSSAQPVSHRSNPPDSSGVWPNGPRTGMADSNRRDPLLTRTGNMNAPPPNHASSSSSAAASTNTTVTANEQVSVQPQAAPHARRMSSSSAMRSDSKDEGAGVPVAFDEGILRGLCDMDVGLLSSMAFDVITKTNSARSPFLRTE